MKHLIGQIAYMRVRIVGLAPLHAGWTKGACVVTPINADGEKHEPDVQYMVNERDLVTVAEMTAAVKARMK